MTNLLRCQILFVSNRCRFLAALLVASGQFPALHADDLRSASPFIFRDVAEAAGVLPAAAGIQAHGAGWGDANGDGHWIDVQVAGGNGVNRIGVGSLVEIYEAGKAGVAEARIGSREIATGYGYASTQEAIAHFGLGERTACDVVVTFPHGRGKVISKHVETNQRIVLKQ